MSFVDQANSFKSRLNALKEHVFVSQSAYLIDDKISSINETVSSMKNAYGEYFNEYGMPTPEHGEGMHFMTGNGYCGSIPLAYEYHKIREMLLNSLGGFTVDETTFFKNFREKLDRFENVTLPEWEAQYEEYNRNPPIPAAGFDSDDESSESSGSGSAIPSPEDFWTRYGLKEQFSTFIVELGQIMFNCREACKTLKQEINKWLTLGSETALSISLAQHINSLPAEIYSKLAGEQGAAGVYSAKIKRAITTSNKIKERYPESSIARQNLGIRDVVCNQLEVKSKSNTIYNNIKSILVQFGVSFGRSER